METIRLSVPGMDCGGWLATMRMAVRRLNVISTVEGDLGSRTLTVAFEPAEVSLETIQRALRTVGYESNVVAWGPVHHMGSG